METSLDFTDTYQAVHTLVKTDADCINCPPKVARLTLANRSAYELMFKRTQSTDVPTTVAEGFRLDAEGAGIWYITLENVDLTKMFIKTTTAEATGEVDCSMEF